MKYWTKFFRLVLTLKLVENMLKVFLMFESVRATPFLGRRHFEFITSNEEHLHRYRRKYIQHLCIHHTPSHQPFPCTIVRCQDNQTVIYIESCTESQITRLAIHCGCVSYLIQFRGSFSQSVTQRNLSQDIHPTGKVEQKKKTDWHNSQQKLND